MNAMWKYVLYTYLLFWFIVLALGGTAAMLFHAPPGVMNAVSILGSWSPTIVLLLMLKKLKPGLTIADFYRKVFRARLNLPMLIAIPVIVFGIFVAAVWLVSVMQKTTFVAQLVLPSALGGVILLTALQGPSGEESGWRGYLRPEMEERYGFIKGNIILGLVWAFWHTPLWFVASGFSGWQLVIYIVANILVMTALTFLMAIFMKRCNNLLIAFWVHFCINFSLRFIAGGATFFAIMSVLYVIVVLALLLFYDRNAS